MKRGNVAWLLVLLVVMSQSVSANFACGVLEGTEDLSASWFEVEAYYSDNPSEVAHCEVSPDEGKFCCDPEEIESENWAIGREITAEVFEHGYRAGPVSLEASGEGYDVFPTMYLSKLIDVHSPNESVYVGEDEIFVNVSTAEGYNSISILINYSGEIVNEEWGLESLICEDCNHAEFFLEDLPFGHYELIFVASGGLGEVEERVEFYLLEYLSFSRNVECSRCRNYFIPSRQVVEIEVGFETSHPVSGKFRDYFPMDWKLVDDTGSEANEFSDTHNVISWDVGNVREFKKQYSLLAPGVFFTQRYYFQSAFEDYLGEREPLSVYWFYRFWPYPQKFLRDISGINYFSRYAFVSPDNALVMDFEDDLLVQLAIFPDEELEDVYAFVHKKSPIRKSGASEHFVLGTNIASTDIENILIQFKVEKPGFWREVEGVDFYQYEVESDTWESVEVEEYDEDEDYVYFKVYVDDKGAFALEPQFTW